MEDDDLVHGDETVKIEGDLVMKDSKNEEDGCLALFNVRLGGLVHAEQITYDVTFVWVEAISRQFFSAVASF